MEWSRIKTIILIILAVTNVSLLGFLVQRELQVQNARQEARQNSIQFLENNGVTVEDETVPEEMTLLPQTVEWDRGQEREAAAVLLGGEVQEQAWSDEIYRYYNETGSIQFHRDGTFQGEFVEGAFRLEEQDAAAYSLQILEILGIQGENLSVQADGGEEDTSATIAALWQDGYLVDTHTAVAAKVLADYRRETGDESPAVFASTASPYKFCDSVLAAIGEEPVSDSVDRIAQLQEVSGVPAPSRLAALKGKAPRFDGVADREEMEQVVLDFLK